MTISTPENTKMPDPTTEESKDELKTMLAEARKEVTKCYEIAQILDVLNPELSGAWIGTPSERIIRQLTHLGILNDTCISQVLNKPEQAAKIQKVAAHLKEITDRLLPA